MNANTDTPAISTAQRKGKHVAIEEIQYDCVLRNISHYFGRNQVLHDVSLSIKKGEFFGILGPSGSGKTTTMRIIGGFIIPGVGEVYLQNELMGPRPAYRRNTTMVFQHLALFPHMTVFTNLAYGLKIRNLPAKEIKARVAGSLDLKLRREMQIETKKAFNAGWVRRLFMSPTTNRKPSICAIGSPS